MTNFGCLTLLHSKGPKLDGNLAILSAVWLLNPVLALSWFFFIEKREKSEGCLLVRQYLFKEWGYYH